MQLPILYSFRRCPYAIRARLALAHCACQYELREVVLKDKPPQLLKVSSKGTVPVLVLVNTGINNVETSGASQSYRVIDESLDIMHWAINENLSRDLQNAAQWHVTESLSTIDINALIEQNDVEFKPQLDKYKYSDRYPERSQACYLEATMPFLEKLEAILSQSAFIGGSQFRYVDAAILPFIRQFSLVNPKQFNALALPSLQRWLADALQSELFLSVMQKVPPWKAENTA